MIETDKEARKISKLDAKSFYPLFCTAVFILILMKFPFHDFESVFYDLWVKGTLKTQPSTQYVLVSINETDDQILGDFYPYTYSTHRKLVENIVRDNPIGLTYLHSFTDPVEEVDRENYVIFHNELNSFIENGGLFQIGTSMDYLGEQVPPEKLQRLGFSPALINVDGEDFARDGIHRKAILNISGEESFHVKVAAMLAQKNGLSEIDSSNIWGAYYQDAADAKFAYYKHKVNLSEVDDYMETMPFYKIVNGNVPPGYFKDKFIIIGPSYLSNSDDFIYTSQNASKLVPKIFVHASMIDSIYRGSTIYEVPEYLSDIIALLMAVFLSLLVSRVKPSSGLFLTIGVMLIIVISSFLMFTIFNMWIKIAHMILSIFTVNYIWFPFRAISEYQTRFAIEEESNLIKKVENLKQNFISLMSHDLKTPVAKIAGIADNLKMRVEGDVPRRMIGDIIDSTKELNTFITSILDLTKVESRNLSLNKTSKDVNKIIEDVVSKLKYEAERDQVEVELDLAPLYPIEIDPILIHRVFSNIIENAIKYSGEGDSVEVKTYDDEKWVTIEIKDNGPGIAPNDLEHIFDKFYRVKNDSSHKIKGSGLGLYLVKYFVELHDGKIEVQSTQGEGTTFKVTLLNK